MNCPGGGGVAAATYWQARKGIKNVSTPAHSRYLDSSFC